MNPKGDILVVGGKGGVGKTSISALMVKLLRDRKLLVIDADPVVSITYTLGEQSGTTIGDYRETLIEDAEVRRGLQTQPLQDVIRGLVTNTANGYDLLTMGCAEATGCFCGINDLLRHGIETLCGEYDLSLIDCEAGIEQVNRRTVHRIDKLLLVTDTSRRGFEAIAKVRDLAKKYNDGKPLEVITIINRVNGQEQLELAQETAKDFSLEDAICVPEDPALLQANAAGTTLIKLPDDSKAVVALKEAALRLGMA